MQKPIVKEYSRLARVYDEKWSFYTEATARETIKRLNLRSSDRLLDVGCGTGTLLQYLSEQHPVTQLSGVDPVKEMLEVARRKLSTAIDIREGWATQLPFPEEEFDVVVSCSVFHYITDPVAALKEIHRVLRPGGRLIITDWCNDFVTTRIIDFFLRRFNKAHFKAYRSREMENLLQKNNYTILNTDRYKINPWWGLMTIQCTA